LFWKYDQKSFVELDFYTNLKDKNNSNLMFILIIKILFGLLKKLKNKYIERKKKKKRK
jgi:hypothetical protein